jgi:hypothetical protein
MLAGIQRQALKGSKQVCLRSKSGDSLIVLGTCAWLWARIASSPGVVSSLGKGTGKRIKSLHHARVLHSPSPGAIREGAVGVIGVVVHLIV